jgi:hypothetical protein
MVSIPFSRSKHYLTGIDWILHGFDYMNKKATGAGNAFQIVMELEGVPAEGEVRHSLDGFIRKFPLLSGRARRDYNLAPYWEIPSRTHESALVLDVHHLQDGEDAFPVLERLANTPFGSEREHLAFYLLRAGENSRVAVKFDHRLFDAHGAEAFLRMFQQDWEEGGASSWELPLPEPAHLSGWRSKFESGRYVNRTLLGLGKDAPPLALPFDPTPIRQGFRFSVIPFTDRHSQEIIERAESEAGYLMAMPYTMALAVQALHAVFAGRGIDTGDYVVPVTMDTRPPSKSSQDVFFNHVSLLLFRIRPSEVNDFPALVSSIKRQMYEQARTGLARHLLDASLLMRIAPLPVMNSLLKFYLKEKIASFCFSFLGDTGHMPTHFMGKKVRRSHHMMRIPIPPGLGVFFRHSHGRLDTCLSYAQGLLTEAEVDTVLDCLKSKLAG